MRFSRTSLVAGASAAYATICIARYPAGAAEFSYKLSTDEPANQPQSARFIEAAVKIQRESNGRMEIKVFPNSVLGGDPDTLQQLRVGALEFLQCGNATLANLVPSIGISYLPFIFPKYESAWSAWDGPLGNYFRGALAKVGIYSFGKVVDGSFQTIFNNVRPISKPDDVKNMKIRVPPSAVWNAVIKALGASPVSMSYREIYTSLQTKLVDGTTFGLSFVEEGKFYEVLKYGSTMNLAWGSISLIGNAELFQKLPKDLRDIVERNFNAATVLERQDNQRGDAGYVAKLKEHGMQFAPADTAAFQDLVRKAGLYTQWRQTYGDEAWNILEKAVGKLS